ncbi:polyprenyl synthetase family protein [Halanaerobium hydrogeniformans]|uniref:polyprenyl synthetase family protein n=1 Tax=Halanaerobium hydrogeniformans TaxID=656519 RepID=UPI001EE64372|nr:polyprenyl synthetase family protein [Halanaerobium hydrogeniformans]
MEILLIEDRYYKNIVKKLDKNIIEKTTTHREIINSAIVDLIDGGGKKLRPFLMFLAASFGDYDKKELLDLGSSIEILHMASLLHDDIIDDADLRRGKVTAQKRFGKNEAVFIGDFLISRTFDILFEYLDKETLIKMNKNLRLICEGEIEQAEKKYDFNISIRDYYRRIRHKTALLFAISSYLGAYVSGIRGKKLNILYKLGLEIGMAFQIQDDILDFNGEQAKTGKKIAKDLEEGVITLPVILLFQKEEYQKKYSHVLEMGGLKNTELDNRKLEQETIISITEDVRNSSVLEESREILKIFITRVDKYLNYLPKNKAKKRLKKLIAAQIDRKY